VTTRGCDNGADVLICSNGVGLTKYLGVEYKCCNSDNCNWNLSSNATAADATFNTTTVKTSTTSTLTTATYEDILPTHEIVRNTHGTASDLPITSCYTGASTVGYSIANCSSPSNYCLVKIVLLDFNVTNELN
jgi:hypothetical protein